MPNPIPGRLRGGRDFLISREESSEQSMKSIELMSRIVANRSIVAHRFASRYQAVRSG